MKTKDITELTKEQLEAWIKIEQVGFIKKELEKELESRKWQYIKE